MRRGGNKQAISVMSEPRKRYTTSPASPTDKTVDYDREGVNHTCHGIVIVMGTCSQAHVNKLSVGISIVRTQADSSSI